MAPKINAMLGGPEGKRGTVQVRMRTRYEVPLPWSGTTGYEQRHPRARYTGD